MKYYLFLFTCIFFSCASQGSPNGGPIDDEGPQVISIFPKSNSKILEEDKIVIISQLDSQGAFEKRGSVPKVAHLLNISIPTVYKYLKQGRIL